MFPSLSMNIGLLGSSFHLSETSIASIVSGWHSMKERDSLKCCPPTSSTMVLKGGVLSLSMVGGVVAVVLFVRAKSRRPEN
mmetsp:Transcript_1632/g.3068  ORF Transcript_1632/g.3068 Transcript_1632/m.3068 type:complete len:81 (-) Transcript_1632:3089-3331(-)